MNITHNALIFSIDHDGMQIKDYMKVERSLMDELERLKLSFSTSTSFNKDSDKIFFVVITKTVEDIINVSHLLFESYNVKTIINQDSNGFTTKTNGSGHTVYINTIRVIDYNEEVNYFLLGDKKYNNEALNDDLF